MKVLVPFVVVASVFLCCGSSVAPTPTGPSPEATPVVATETATATETPRPSDTPPLAPTPTRPSPEATWTATPTVVVPATDTPAAGGCPYVGNRNTKKFHIASCASVGEMKAENRVCFGSREEAVGAGYEPCGRCKP